MARIMKKNVNTELSTITFSFANGETYTAHVDLYPAETKSRLMMHGAAQKLGDTCAGKDEGEWLSEIMAMDERLSNGEWGAERGNGLEEKLEAAEKHLAAYDAMTDEQKKLMLDAGVNRTILLKVVTTVKKAIAKRDAAK